MPLNKQDQKKITPSLALSQLKEGHQRFVNEKQKKFDKKKLIDQTKNSQYPRAIIISCIDSRVPVEQIFDQQIGDVFVARVAGNIVNKDILASIEYACAVSGSPLVFVLGHKGCGAVKSACDDVKLSHITDMLQHLKPSIEKAKKNCYEPHDSSNISFVSSVTQSNVLITMSKILKESKLLQDLYDKGRLAVSGGVYDIANGTIKWL